MSPEEVKALRQSTGLTQADFAQVAHLDVGTISRAERRGTTRRSTIALLEAAARERREGVTPRDH